MSEYLHRPKSPYIRMCIPWSQQERHGRDSVVLHDKSVSRIMRAPVFSDLSDTGCSLETVWAALPTILPQEGQCAARHDVVQLATRDYWLCFMQMNSHHTQFA